MFNKAAPLHKRNGDNKDARNSRVLSLGEDLAVAASDSAANRVVASTMFTTGASKVSVTELGNTA